MDWQPGGFGGMRPQDTECASRIAALRAGDATECAVIMTSGKPRLDEAACTTAKNRWKFKAVIQNRRPVGSQQIAQMVFQLK